MRIHSDRLTGADVMAAARRAEIMVEGYIKYGSRSRKRAYDIAFSGSGASGGQWGNGGYKSATWDEWGIALAHLFDADPDAHTGLRGYRGYLHFHWVTGQRFRVLTPALQHYRHRWEHVGNFPEGYVEHACECGATWRQMTPGTSWDQLAALVS